MKSEGNTGDGEVKRAASLWSGEQEEKEAKVTRVRVAHCCRVTGTIDGEARRWDSGVHAG